MSLFLAILPLGLLALVSPLQTNSGFLARLLQFLFLNRKLSGLGATSILLTMIANLLFLSCTGTGVGNLYTWNKERARLHALLVSQYTSTANGNMMPEKMYMIGKPQVMACCILYVDPASKPWGGSCACC